MSIVPPATTVGQTPRLVWSLDQVWWESLPRACSHRDLVAASTAGGRAHALRRDIECLRCQRALAEMYHALDHRRGYCDCSAL